MTTIRSSCQNNILIGPAFIPRNSLPGANRVIQSVDTKQGN
uniref:Uncharacterized protein n=1 Tax=Arundo donax TaxID=35708 RepID=A0A0A8YUF5_ARUDO